MSRLGTAECLILGSSGRLVSDKIRPGPAQSRRTHRLMGIDHYLIFGGLGDGIQIMVYHPLAVMLFPARKHISDITGFDGIVAVVFHKCICCVEMPFVVSYGSGSLVMHDHFHTFGLGIVTDFLKIEIRIRSHEIEDIVLKMAEPVLPALVPALDKHSVEAVFRGEVNVFLHICSSCSMMTVRLYFRIISDSELHGRQVPGIGPL